MRIKDIVVEDFVNYHKACMFIITAFCSFKCDKESGKMVCQNSSLAHQPTLLIDDERIISMYINNPITEALCFGGLEPLDQFDEMVSLISRFREISDDPIIIYTGYTEDEVASKITVLTTFSNIIIKFGRFIPDQPHHVDPLLGVELASSNQYAKRLEEVKDESQCK
jgi:hypothetical protein